MMGIQQRFLKTGKDKTMSLTGTVEVEETAGRGTIKRLL